MITTELPAQDTPVKNTLDTLGQLPAQIEEQATRLNPRALVVAAAASVGLSLFLKITGRSHDALFVGQWAPTLLLLGIYNRLSRQGLSPGQKS